MTTNYHITVTFDGEELTVEPESLELATDTSPIHSVAWTFKDVEDRVAAGWLVKIVFEPATSHPTLYSGPFVSLSTTRARVIACGNAGILETFRYRAVLEPPAGEQSYLSAAATIVNHVGEARQPVIEVRSVDGGPELEVFPREVSLIAGQPLRWQVVEPPRAIGLWTPRLLFDSGHPYLGPFGSLDVADAEITAYGSGQKPSRYGYEFQMASVEGGNVLARSSPDPTIDDEGDPPIDTEPTRNE